VPSLVMHDTILTSFRNLYCNLSLSALEVSVERASPGHFGPLGVIPTPRGLDPRILSQWLSTNE
jgi:hypothetical protein